MRNISHFIERVQRSDPETKSRWVFLFSGISMILVIGLWVLYVDATTPSGGSSTRAPAERAEAVATTRPGVFATFAAGVSIIFDQAKKTIYHGRTETVEREGGDIFEPIPPTALP